MSTRTFLENVLEKEIISPFDDEFMLAVGKCGEEVMI